MKLVNPEQILAAYDAIAIGGKAGEFEVQDMARHLPSLLAKMEKLGEAGVTGVRNTVAISQAVRKVVGSSDEAATIMENLLDTFTSREFVEGAKKVGINVEKTMRDAKDKGLSPVFAMLHQLHRVTGGDPFKIAKLIPNKRAADALVAVLREIGFIMEILDEMTDAAGTTMKDYETATDNARESWERFSSSIIERSKEIAEKSLPAVTDAMDAVTEALENPEQRRGGLFDYLNQLGDLFNPAKLATKANEAGKAVTGADGETVKRILFGKTYDERKADAYREYARTRMASRRSLVPAIPLREGEDASMKAYRALRDSGDLEAILEEGRAERERLREARRQANRNLIYTPIEMPGSAEPGRADDGTPMPTSKPGSTFQRMLDGMRNPAGDAAEEAMNEFNEALGRGLEEARSRISTAVAEFRQMLSFSAGPTISPTIVPASATVASPATGGGGGGTANVNVTQNFTNTDPRMAQRRAQREQNRSMSLALANALHDTRLA